MDSMLARKMRFTNQLFLLYSQQQKMTNILSSCVAQVNQYLYDIGVMKTFEETYQKDRHAIGARDCHPYPGHPGFSLVNVVSM
jgi:hypothetical protein